MKTVKKIEQHLRVLCEEIGARPTGSPANMVAVDYVCKEFISYGLDVQRQNFECMDWNCDDCTLTIGSKEIPVQPSPYSLACDVKGEIICVHSLEELRCSKIAGKLVLLCDTLACEALMPKNFVFWNPDEHKEIISLLEIGKPLAVLTVSLLKERFVPVIEDGDFELPCAIVAAECAALFYNGTVASLKIRTNRTPVTASNIIATYGSGDQKICFSAHIDTKEKTSGALDNASGTAVLLTLASELAGHHFPYRIEFVLFNGEDYYSNPGEMSYLSSFLSHSEEFVCAYNLDGVGLINQKTSYSFYECCKKRMDSVNSCAAKFNEFVQTEPWPQGDHTLFSSSGVPAIAITSCGIFNLVDHVLHTENDTLKLIDTEKLETIVNFLIQSL